MNDNLDIRLGEWLSEQRKMRGLTMQDVADRLGVTKTAVHYWETGKRSMYARHVLDYCEALGIDADEIIRALRGGSDDASL